MKKVFLSGFIFLALAGTAQTTDMALPRFELMATAGVFDAVPFSQNTSHYSGIFGRFSLFNRVKTGFNTEVLNMKAAPAFSLRFGFHTHDNKGQWFCGTSYRSWSRVQYAEAYDTTFFTGNGWDATGFTYNIDSVKSESYRFSWQMASILFEAGYLRKLFNAGPVDFSTGLAMSIGFTLPSEMTADYESHQTERWTAIPYPNIAYVPPGYNYETVTEEHEWFRNTRRTIKSIDIPLQAFWNFRHQAAGWRIIAEGHLSVEAISMEKLRPTGLIFFRTQLGLSYRF